MDAAGTGLTNLTNDRGDDLDPAWSPDGARIAFPSDRNGDIDVFVMNPDGTDVRQLTDNPSLDIAPPGPRTERGSPSPGSERSRLRDLRDERRRHTDPTALTNEATGGTSPDWSPDGTEITFFGVGGVFVMSADGAEIRRLTDDPGAHFEPDWSPDGVGFVFVSERSATRRST
jgi:TolB protein